MRSLVDLKKRQNVCVFGKKWIADEKRSMNGVILDNHHHKNQTNTIELYSNNRYQSKMVDFGSIAWLLWLWTVSSNPVFWCDRSIFYVTHNTHTLPRKSAPNPIPLHSGQSLSTCSWPSLFCHKHTVHTPIHSHTANWISHIVMSESNDSHTHIMMVLMMGCSAFLYYPSSTLSIYTQIYIGSGQKKWYIQANVCERKREEEWVDGFDI